jgi:uncharacterized circularly permuted ATP-grasp superfamily protein
MVAHVKISAYPTDDQFDEMFDADGSACAFGTGFVERLETMTCAGLQQRQRTAELTLRQMGITFNVYGV